MVNHLDDSTFYPPHAFLRLRVCSGTVYRVDPLSWRKGARESVIRFPEYKSIGYDT